MQFLKIDIFDVVIVTSSRNYTSLHYHLLHIIIIFVVLSPTVYSIKNFDC